MGDGSGPLVVHRAGLVGSRLGGAVGKRRAGAHAQAEAAVHRQPADFSIVAPMNGAADASAAYVEALQDIGPAGSRDPDLREPRRRWRGRRDPALSARRAHPGRQRHHLQSEDEQCAQGARSGAPSCCCPVRRRHHPRWRDVILAPRRRCPTRSGSSLALKAGEAPENFAADLERAYINGHQARFLFAADPSASRPRPAGHLDVA